MVTWKPKLIRRLRVLRQVANPEDGFLFGRIFLFLLAVPALLRLRLPRLKTLLEPNKTYAAPDMLRVGRILHHVDTALQFGQPVVRSRCLSRGLTLYFFLRRAGLNVGLCFGAERVGGELEGHCWLTREGEPFAEPEDPRLSYKPVYHFPEADHAGAHPN